MYKDFYNNKLVPFVNKVRMACNVGEIPLVFDNSLTYYEQIAAFSAKLNDVISTVNVQSLTLCEFMQQLTEAFKELSDDFAEQWADIQAAFAQLSGRVNVLDERVTVLENLPIGVGMAIPEGTEYIEPGEDPYIAGLNAEIFNCYEDTESSNKNRAAGDYSHAEGDSTKAYATSSHCEGSRTTALKSAAHAEGMDTTADGLAAHAGGRASFALDAYAFAHGNVATASGEASTAFGSNTTASGDYSHAEGSQTTAGGTSSHAEGAGTRATGNYSHAGGAGCTASGSCSFVHGMSSNASGNNSVAFGADLIASGNDQFVCGHANKEKSSDYLFIIGNGVTSSARSNALEVDRYGNIYINGNTKPLNEIIDKSGVTVYSSSDYTITPYSATNPHADYLTATADGYLIGNLQTVHITGSYTVYYSVSSDEGYKICEIDVPGTIADDEKEIAAVTDYMQYLTSGSVHCLFIAKIETVSSTKKLCIYYKSAGESHGSSGINKSFDITATFKVSG